MKNEEIFLKTLFCCSACDGEIATEEIDLIKKIVVENDISGEINIDETLNSYVRDLNDKGKSFLIQYLRSLESIDLTTDEQLKLIEMAIKIIEVDNQVLYSEISFFKKIRSRLPVLDEEILKYMPDKEDYLLPDIITDDKILDDVFNLIDYKIVSL